MVEIEKVENEKVENENAENKVEVKEKRPKMQRSKWERFLNKPDWIFFLDQQKIQSFKRKLIKERTQLVLNSSKVCQLNFDQTSTVA